MSGWIYMLDTNIVSQIIRIPDGAVARQIENVGSEKLCVSAIVASELRFGAANKRSPRLSSLAASACP